MKKCIRNIGMCLIRVIGSDIRDAADGSYLGRALLLSWRGRVHLIGYEGPPLRPVCVPQSGIKYWRITLGFQKASVPDFPRVGGAE
jgi:hypothetical protein